MKSIKLLFTALAIMLGGVFANLQAQCVASYVDTNWSANAVFFQSTYNGSGGTVWHDWFFQGGTPSSLTGYGQDTVTVTYPSAGWYAVCYTMWDSVANCGDSLCDSVYVGWANSPLNGTTSTTNTNCGACNGTATVSASGGVAPYSYSWSNGSTSPTIQGLCAGAYNVTITDANGSTSILTTVISGTGGASVSITGSTQFCDSADLYATANSGVAPYTYLWNNGQTGAFAMYYASGSGNNLAYVTVTDANGCTGIDSFNINFGPSLTANMTSTDETCLTCCDGTASIAVAGGPANNPYTYSWSNGATTATVTGLCPGTYWVFATDTLSGCEAYGSVTIGAYSCPSISGNITQGDDAMVYLIEENSGILTAIDSVVTDSGGYYSFMNACPGTYYVKAALLPTHSMYTMFVPTYYVNSSLWGAATAVLVSGNTTGIDINLLTGTNTGGPGFIGGAVAQGANRDEGDPIADAQVVLLDANSDVSAFTRTDANGEYAFDNLAYGEYSVYVEMINFDAYPFMVNVNANNEQVQDRDFVLEAGSIKPVTPLGVGSVSNFDLDVYPNPAKDVLTITGSVDMVTVYNLLGETVNSISNNGSENMNIDVKSLASGQYILGVKRGEQTKFVQIVVQ